LFYRFHNHLSDKSVYWNPVDDIIYTYTVMLNTENKKSDSANRCVFT